MKQVMLALRIPLALLVISGAFLLSLRESLGGLPGATTLAWLAWAVLLGGSLLSAIEDAHERERGAGHR